MNRGRGALLTVAALLGAMLTGMLSLIGVSLPYATAWGLLVIVGFALAPGAELDDDEQWPPPMPERTPRGSEVARLAWSFNLSKDTAGPAVRRRVLALVQRRMERHGIDLDDPADRARAEELLGRDILASVFTSEPRREDIDGLLDALDRLEQTPEEKRKS